MQIQAPIRPNDFVNSHIEAPLRWTEEVAGVDRVPLANITPLPESGFIIRLNRSARFCTWWNKRTDVRQLFLAEAVELDPYGTTMLVSRGLNESPDVHKYATIGPWPTIPQAAEILRSVYIGPDFLANQVNRDNVPALYTNEILTALQLAEIPLNGQPSGFCRVKWGVLIRVGPLDVERVVDYLALPKPADPREPVKVNLGANMVAIAAFAPSETEPLSVAVGWRWNDDLATKDLSRWLRKISILNEKKNLLQPT